MWSQWNIFVLSKSSHAKILLEKMFGCNNVFLDGCGHCLMMGVCGVVFDSTFAQSLTFSSQVKLKKKTHKYYIKKVML